MKKRRSIVAAIALIFSSAVSVYAENQYVMNDSGGTENGSFRQVIADALDGDSIRFNTGISSILLEGPAVNTTASISNIGESNRQITLDGGGTTSILRLTNAKDDLTFQNLVFQNANNDRYVQDVGLPNIRTLGGAVRVDGTNAKSLTITGSVFNDNQAVMTSDRPNVFGHAGGGAIYHTNPDNGQGGNNALVIGGSSFSGNRAIFTGLMVEEPGNSGVDGLSRGGAIYSDGIITVTDSRFTGNEALATGGHADEQSPIIPHSAASASGGAMASYGMLVSGSVFEGNRAVATGGAVGASSAYAYGGALDINNSNASEAPVSIRSSLFIDNEASAIGGGGTGNAQEVTTRGGAVRIFGTKNAEIVDTSFFNNRAVVTQNDLSQQVFVSGGAVDYISAGNTTLTLKATAGNCTVFSGNKEIVNYIDDEGNQAVDEKTSSIGFMRTLMNPDNPPITLQIDAEKGGLVALDDPIKVMNGTRLIMNVIGDGEFRWGGTHYFYPSSLSEFHLNAGTVTFAPDFAFENPGVDVTHADYLYDVSMTNDVHLNVNLGGRDPNAAMFENPQTFVVDGSEVAAFSYTLKPTDPNVKYLVTNNRQGVSETNFVIADDPNSGFVTTISTNGEGLYISLDNSGAIAPFRNSSNRNVRNAYRDGNMADVFDSVIAGYNPTEQESMFHEFRNNTQLLTPEAVATQAIAAMDYANYVDRALWQLTNHRNGDTSFGGCDPCAAVGCGSKGKARHLWGGYLGNTADQDDSDGYFGYRAKMDGVIVGFDKDLNRRWNAGAFFSYGSGVNRYDVLASKIDMKAYQTGLYGTWTPNRKWSVRFDTSYGHFDNDFARWNILGAGNGSFAQDLFDIGGLAKRDFRVGKSSKLSPYLGMRYMYLSQQSMTESGTNPFASRIAADHLNSFATTLGAAFSTDVKYRQTIWTPTLYADWRHEFADTQYTTGAGYLGTGAWYELNSIDRARDSADLGFNLMTSWKGRQGWIWDVQVGYNANLTTDFTSQAYYATLGFRF